MGGEKHYRHELKYTVSYSDYLSLRDRLSAVMSVDPDANARGLPQNRKNKHRLKMPPLRGFTGRDLRCPMLPVSPAPEQNIRISSYSGFALR